MWAVAGQVAVRGVWRGAGGSRVAPVRSRKPDVLRLAAEDLPRVLPWSGCGPRLAKEVGDWEACAARVGISLVACAFVYNNSIELASIAGFYWAWAPICSTLLPNLLLRLRYRYAGLWRARVLQVQVLHPPRYVRDESGGLPGKFFNRLPKLRSTLQLEIGDGSQATFKIKVPITDEVPDIQAGEPIDVVVLSDKPSMSRFKALHDLYFPERQIWISENPCIERKPFEELQKSLSRSLKGQSRQGGAYGKTAKLLLEENTLSRDNINWEKALRSDLQAGISEELDYVMDAQEKNNRRPSKGLDDADLYL